MLVTRSANLAPAAAASWDDMIAERRWHPYQSVWFSRHGAGNYAGVTPAGYFRAHDETDTASWMNGWAVWRTSADGRQLIVPHGPVLGSGGCSGDTLSWLITHAAEQHADLVIGPYLEYDEELLNTLMTAGFRDTGQPWHERTVEIPLGSLSTPEDVVMACSSGVRQDIRKAWRSGFTFQRCTDEAEADTYCRMQTEHAGRVGIGAPAPDYIRSLCRVPDSGGSGGAVITAKNAEGRICGGAVVLWTRERALYQYGVVARSGPPVGHALQLWIMFFLRSRGIEHYDLGGLDRRGLAAGVNQFKRSFLGVGRELRLMPELALHA